MKFTVNESKEINVLSDVAMLLLYGVMAGHVHHWNAVGTEAYAEHKAIGKFYEKLDELTDSLIEGCLLDKSKIISTERALFLGKTSLELVRYIYEELSVLRRNPSFPQKSEIQNAVDEIAMLCNHTINQLVRLG